jgi:tetratricopeptide (TPR) repeat protein
MSDHNVCLGRLEHADRWIEETRRLSPDWYFLSLSEAWVRLAQGRYGDLAADADQFLSRDGDDAFGLWYAGEAALYLGELEEAEARWTRLLELSPMWSFAAGAARLRASLVYVRRELGQPERTDALIEEGVRWAEEEVEAGRGPDYPYSLAMLHAVAGRSEESLGWLTRAEEAGFWDYRALERDPRLDALRGDPRFPGIIERTRERTDSMRARVEAREAEEGRDGFPD